jgi:sterol desaturase/sphingolipid hydroxylase (fatty acid hydroxylase superfamily)
MMCEDFFFSMSHRALHTPFLYKHIHKIHHTHIVTVGIASQYAHPLEYFFGNLLPTVAGPLILGSNMHMVSALGWYAMRVIETTEGHSGYDFPCSPFFILPFQPISGYHAFHHSKNVGNYSSFFSIWDTVFNSNKDFYEYIDEQKELKIKSE